MSFIAFWAFSWFATTVFPPMLDDDVTLQDFGYWAAFMAILWTLALSITGLVMWL